MIDPGQIPFLIRLLDDESSKIRETVFRQLTAFGPNLKDYVRQNPFAITQSQRYYLDMIFQDYKSLCLRRLWSSWFDIEDEYEKMERALSILADFLSPGHNNSGISGMLNSLAFSCRVKNSRLDQRGVAEFLFHERGLRGNEDDYYNPQNCNLAYVIKRCKGVPISLAAVYGLVARRLGVLLNKEMFLEHLEKWFPADESDVVIEDDILEDAEIDDNFIVLQDDVLDELDEVLEENLNAEKMIKSFLAHLVRGYNINGNQTHRALIIDLYKQLEFYEEKQCFKDITPEQIIIPPVRAFQSGDVVAHRRFGYRGIVVDIDDECRATDDWYYGSPGQARRFEPWLHVLVDGSEQVSYVAQSCVEKDALTQKIKHPLLPYFFTSADNGSYIRNENPWPNTEF